jgi:hypothetical protein
MGRGMMMGGEEGGGENGTYVAPHSCSYPLHFRGIDDRVAYSLYATLF